MDFNQMYPSRFLKASEVSNQTVTISGVTIEEVGFEKDKKPVAWFEEIEKGLVLNKTNGATIANEFGTNTDAWIGKRIKLGTEMVLFQGKNAPAIRVKKADQQVLMPAPAAAPAAPPPPPAAAPEIPADVSGEGEAGYQVTGVKQPKAGIYIIEVADGTFFRTTNKDWALAAKGAIGKESIGIGWKTAADNIREVTRLDVGIPF